MNKACKICKGACCESMLIDFGKIPDDAKRWLSLHIECETMDNGTEAHRIRKPCSKLQAGKCSIYEDRPQLCKDYAVGSEGCVKAVLMHRSRKEQRKILAEINVKVNVA